MHRQQIVEELRQAADHVRKAVDSVDKVADLTEHLPSTWAWRVDALNMILNGFVFALLNIADDLENRHTVFADNDNGDTPHETAR